MAMSEAGMPQGEKDTIGVRLPLSFEFFPPKTPEGVEKLRDVRQKLYALSPQFCSVTYGAGGSTQEGTFSAVGAILAEGVACYRTFIRGLLDITDNIVDGAVVPPEQVVRHDADDPYLVVAADKGTATFSDYANGVSAEYGFWLRDAFASGGSAGYDHKKMGITARGAWESGCRRRS